MTLYIPGVSSFRVGNQFSRSAHHQLYYSTSTKSKSILRIDPVDPSKILAF